MSDALKPCPFCGSPAEAAFIGESSIVACTSEICDARLGLCRTLTDVEVAEAWNTRAALEQGEAVVWQYTGEDGEECYTTIKAKALQFDANPTPLYTAPPSTAEAQARALPFSEAKVVSDLPEVHEALRNFSHDSTEDNAVCLIQLVSVVLADAEAKRIREEG